MAAAEELWRHPLAGLTAQAIWVAAELNVAEHVRASLIEAEPARA